jgi:hypothetical protein
MMLKYLRMIDKVEQKMLSEMKTIQDQITELKVQE